MAASHHGSQPVIPPVGEGAATPPCTSSADAGRDRRPTHQQPISFSTPVLSVNVGSLSGTSYSLDLDKQTLETAPTNAKPTLPGRHQPLLAFSDPLLEEMWIVHLRHHYRRSTWGMQAVGSVLFLLLAVQRAWDEDGSDLAVWKFRLRLAVGFVAIVLVLVEQVSSFARNRMWLHLRSSAVLLVSLWAVLFSAGGGLQAITGSGGPCTAGEYQPQEFRVHPVYLVILLSGPLLKAPFRHVLFDVMVTSTCELVMLMSASRYRSLRFMVEFIPSLILCTWVTALVATARVRAMTVGRVSQEMQSSASVGEPRLPSTSATSNIGEIESTSEKVLQLLNKIRDRGGSEEIITEVMDLMQRDHSLFMPDLSELDSGGVDASIREWLLHGPARLGDHKGPIRRLASLDAPPKDPTPRRATSLTQELNLNAALVKFVCTTDFSRFDLDVFQLATQHPRPLSLVAEASLLSMNVLDSLPLRAAKVHRFLALLDGAYVSSNPYHNAIHAASVTWDMQYFLRVGKAERFLRPIEVFACIVAAAGHDVKHPARNNQFLIAARSNVAITYNDISVLENFHCAETFTIAHSPECGVFEGMEAGQYSHFRKTVVKMILASDVSKHFEHVAKLKTQNLSTPRASSGSVLGSVASLDLLVQSLMMICDIGHAAKPYGLHSKWCELVSEEFCQQGDEEKKLGLPVSPLCDRETLNVAKSQVGFFNFLVLPLFGAFAQARFCVGFEPILRGVHSNFRTWKSALRPGAAKHRPVATLPVVVEV